ncbi:MAG: hypothetical protein KDB80_16220 [Planctomycetes bacterium]|nr:hypothetical protein [Planctomycetota bacterium]
MRARSLSVVTVATLLVAPVVAQEFRWEPVASLGINVRVHKKLKPVPVEIGSNQSVQSLHLRARFDPESSQQNIMKGTQPFRWGMDVLAFDQAPEYADKPKDQDEVRRRAIEKRKYDAGARNYEHYLKEKLPGATDREFRGHGGADGTEVKEKRGVPAHTIWEYAQPAELDDGTKFHWYTYAAAYKLEGREVALAFSWPIFKDEPDRKYLDIAKKMTTVIQVEESQSSAVEANAEKDRFADTPERKAALEAAVASIRGIDGWDYFTTPAAIVLYSWKPDSNKQAKALKAAEPVAEHFTAMQELYRETFPPPETMPTSYPVVRMCYERHLMRLYGSPPVRAESFYNDTSGEIVITMDGKQSPESQVAREGWYHYADQMFRGAKLSGWYAHGFAHWFGAWSLHGKRWSFEPDKLRINGDDGAKKAFKSDDQPGLKEFLNMHGDKFEESEDNETAGQMRSRAYAMVDMLMRGEKKLGGSWDEKWSQIVPGYTETMLKTKSASKANRAFDDIDPGAFEQAWAKWATSQISKK